MKSQAVTRFAPSYPPYITCSPGVQTLETLQHPTHNTHKRAVKLASLWHKVSPRPTFNPAATLISRPLESRSPWLFPLAFISADTLRSLLPFYFLLPSSYLMDGAESSSESEIGEDDQSDEEMDTTVCSSWSVCWRQLLHQTIIISPPFCSHRKKRFKRLRKRLQPWRLRTMSTLAPPTSTSQVCIHSHWWWGGRLSF